MVASVAALALVLGLGYQLSRDAAPSLEAPLQAQTAPPKAVPEVRAEPFDVPAVVTKAPVNSMASTALPAKKAVPSALAADDPTQFILNDATRSKAWPKRDQGMDDYLARHNQMADAAAGSDLITYAQWVSEPESAPEKNNPEQDKK
jgi:hypothetical protein